MRSHFFLLFLLANVCLSCSTAQHEGKLELSIITQELRIPDEGDYYESTRERIGAEITYRLTNNSNRDLMLYNFRRNLELAYDFENELPCDTAFDMQQTRVFVFTKKGDYVGAYFELHGRDTSTHFPDYESRERAQCLWHRNAKVIVKSGESLNFTRRIDFWNYRFMKRFSADTFYVKLDYVQYRKPDEISTEELESDLAGSTMFRGCLSAQVRLIVGTPKKPKKPDSIFLEEVEVIDSTGR